jgi:hypothetical protein
MITLDENDPTSIEELQTLALTWRLRAKYMMGEVGRRTGSSDAIRVTAMAAALEWAAGDLYAFVGYPELKQPE